MDLREECKRELHRIAEEVNGLNGEESYSAKLILDAISEAHTAIDYFGRYADGGGKPDLLIRFCKANLRLAKREAKTNREEHALWRLRLAISSFLSNREADAPMGIT